MSSDDASRDGTSDFFVQNLYFTVLNRPVDAPSKAALVQYLDKGGSRQAVADGVLTSAEANGVLTRDYYDRFLHRPAEPGALSYWVASLQQGNRDEGLAASIIGSDEYFALP